MNVDNVDLVDAFSQVLTSRRSIRGFKSEPLPDDKLQSIFSLAQHSPSNCNTQPWHVAVVSGEKCDSLRQQICQAMEAGQMALDFPYLGKYEGIYKERQYDAALQLYNAMGIARDDKAKRGEAFARNFTFFGAPHVAFIFIPDCFGIREAADIGMYAQSLMLSITAHGAASCPQTSLSFHSDIVRKSLAIEGSMKLLFGISFGYEDNTVAANAACVEKAALEETVTFYW